MNITQSDLISRYKLKREFFQDHVRNTGYAEKAKNRNEKVKEEWSNCGELGCEGFGAVHRQIQKTSGRYRAVKAIDGRRYPPRYDYSRNLFVMAMLVEACILTLGGICPMLTASTGLTCCGLIVSCFSILYYL